MAAPRKETTLYVRNARPNTLVIRYGDLRIPLAHRGGLGRDINNSPGDSCALPIEAAHDPSIMRWLNNGTLEKITEDDFMRLGQRRVDTLPNEFIKSQRDRPVRMFAAGEANASETNTANTLTHIKDRDVQQSVREQVSPKWAGDLMSTSEELDAMPPDTDQDRNYPSKYRDNDEERRRQMGY